METKPELIFRKGKRVSLRIFTEDDAPTLAKWMNDPEVNIYTNQHLPRTTEFEVGWVKKLEDRPNDFIFGLEINDGTLIGMMGLHDINRIHGTATTGAIMGEKEYWGKGYGSEAKMLLLKYAFDTLNIRKICATVFSFNERSLRYQEKCGYKIEGSRKDQFFKNGQYGDEVLMAVYREDWLPVWENYQKTGRV